MSLRYFHLLFILLSALTAAGFAVWLAMAPASFDGGWTAAGTVVSGLVAAGLVAYAVRFFRKSKGLGS